jgi:hypothetical protein
MTTKLTEKNISSVANAGISWQSVIVADGSTGTTGVAGRGYFINTTSAAHTFTLPATATFADTILIKDYAGTFATFNLTIARNGHNIQGSANNSLISTNRASLILVYVDVTRGWEFVTESNVAFLGPLYITATGGTITTDGDFKVHSFTGDGCFVVSCAGNPAGSTSVDYLVVAGGGGAGSGGLPGEGAGGGGGGAGGFRTSFPGGTKITTPATTYPVTVGGGGPGGPAVSQTKGTSGSPSIFSTITSTGGGGGGRYSSSPGNQPGNTGIPGGSGGGASGYCNVSGGTGNSPPVSPPQGNPGGTGNNYTGGPAVFSGAGGGGASATGSSSTTTAGGAGGAGSSNSISGSSVAYAGGGAGGAGSGSPVSGGTGGGGNSTTAPSTGGAGTVNTGGGGAGGGGANDAGGSGGKGIVIIRYKFQ